MASVVAIGVGVAAAAFLVSTSDQTHQGMGKLTYSPGTSRTRGDAQIPWGRWSCRSAGEGILQGRLRAQDEPQGGISDSAAEVRINNSDPISWPLLRFAHSDN